MEILQNLQFLLPIFIYYLYKKWSSAAIKQFAKFVFRYMLTYNNILVGKKNTIPRDIIHLSILSLAIPRSLFTW